MRRFFVPLVVTAALGFSIVGAAETEVEQLSAEAARYRAGETLESFRRMEALVQRAVAEPRLRKVVEAGLVSLLQEGATAEARLFACKQLGIIGGQDSVPVLAKLLEDPEAVSYACLALTTYPAGKADEALMAALERAQGKARVQIINTIGDRRDPKAVKALLKVAKGSDATAAEAAIAAVGKIGNAEAGKGLVALQEGRLGREAVLTQGMIVCANRLATAGRRKQAAQMLESLVQASNPDYIRRGAFAGLLRLDKDQGEERIMEALSGNDAVLKPVAIASIGFLPGQEASERFGGMMSGLTAQEQVWMIESLARRGDATARQAIARALSTPEATVRRAAIAAVGQTAGCEGVPLLGRALASTSDAGDRRALESALTGLGGARETDAAVMMLLEESRGDVRVSLIGVLANRQGAEANSVLLQEAGSDSAAVASAALRSLARTATAKEAFELVRLVGVMDNGQSRAAAESAAAQALGKVERASKRSEIVRNQLKLTGKVPNRAALIGLLPVCADSAALAEVKNALVDANADLRETGARALADWPDPTAWPDLARTWSGSEDARVRAITLQGLVRMASAEAAQESVAARYKQLLEGAQGESELKLILGALGGAHWPATLEMALPLLSNAGVHNEAKVAVKQIAESIKNTHPEAAKAALDAIAEQ